MCKEKRLRTDPLSYTVITSSRRINALQGSTKPICTGIKNTRYICEFSSLVKM